MAVDGDEPGDDRASRERLRRRLYQRDADPSDVVAYESIRGRADPRSGAATATGLAPARDGARPRPAADDPVGGGTLRRWPARGRVVALICAVAVAVTALVLLWPGRPSLGPLVAAPTRLAPLAGAGATAPLPEGLDSAAVASFFERVPSAPAEQTTAARKPFFGGGVGPTDFTPDGYDIGANTVSVTVVADGDGRVGAELAAVGAGSTTHRVFAASGSATTREPIAAQGLISGLEAPQTLRIDVPAGTRFVVRAVFLTPIDPGTLGP